MRARLWRRFRGQGITPTGKRPYRRRVKQLNKRKPHGRPLSEIESEKRFAKTGEERCHEQQKAGARDLAAGDQGEGRGDEKEVTDQSRIFMAKTQNSQKKTLKKPLKTPAEKKAAKREKKNK
jgi:hypothetical protein